MSNFVEFINLLIYVNYVIIYYAILKGGIFINTIKTLTKDTKFYICKYGIFYEGQVLEQFAGIGEHKIYIQDVILEKFIIHFKAGQNYTLHFRISNFNTKEKNVLPVELLGINYKIKKI